MSDNTTTSPAARAPRAGVDTSESKANTRRAAKRIFDLSGRVWELRDSMSEEGIEVPDAVWNDMERSGERQLGRWEITDALMAGILKKLDALQTAKDEAAKEKSEENK